ncbi:hypothetical protein FGO68_gene8279 [Halteria grandinella]|uniref:Uncharacterized protein n=1 Tax=Halteria grandinella TaxID=5974 RepID=A0A8J8NJB8_HALGN|nr:hypothetical protein FGO68_gene8279 [Halteria grandinella]
MRVFHHQNIANYLKKLVSEYQKIFWQRYYLMTLLFLKLLTAFRYPYYFIAVLSESVNSPLISKISIQRNSFLPQLSFLKASGLS